jgi:hypothetical protein
MKIKNAEYVKEYKVKLLFNNGIEKEVDFKPFLKNAKNLFVPLLDLAYFKQFSVNDTTICWPNEVDFCPDVLYEIGAEVKKSKPSLKVRRQARVKCQATFALAKKKPK